MLFGIRGVFIFLLAVSTVLAVRFASSYEIDTNLADITPATIETLGTASAVAALQANIEARVILLLREDDEDQLELADEELRQRLSNIDNIQVHPSNEALVSSIMSSLKPYRFAFLNAKQKAQLATKTPTQIADESYRKLLSIGGFNVFDFVDDPTGWHGEALLDLLPVNSAEGESDKPIRLIGLSINRGAMDMRTQQELSEQLDWALSAVTKKFAVTANKSGVFFFAADAAQSAKRDVSLISTVSTLGVIGLLLLAFRSFKSLLLPVSSVIFGVCFAALVTHSIYGSLHILTIVFGASLIGIAIDYALHFMVHNSQHQEIASQRALYRALSLSLATSLLGYAALGLAGLAALEKVAVFSCSGLLMAWLSVICLGPIVSNTSKDQPKILQPLTLAISNAVRRVPKYVIIGLGLVFITTGLWVSTNSENYSDDPRVFFSPSADLLASEREVAKVASDFEPGRYLIITGENQAEVYSRYQALMVRVVDETDYSVDDFSSIPTWLPSQSEQAANYAASEQIYQAGSINSQLVNKLEANSELPTKLYEEYRRSQGRWLSAAHLAELLGANFPPFWFTEDDDSVVSFVLLRKGLNADKLATITASLEGTEYVNSLQRTSQALGKQRAAAIKFLGVAVLLIALLVMLRYRSWRAGTLLLVPLCAIFGFIASCYLLGVAMNLFHVMALFLVLGFGMDYVIFVNEMRKNSNIALHAILLSSLTSLLSFGLLSLSSIPVVSSFGLTLLVGNLINLVGAFFLAQLLNTHDEQQASQLKLNQYGK